MSKLEELKNENKALLIEVSRLKKALSQAIQDINYWVDRTYQANRELDTARRERDALKGQFESLCQLLNPGKG